MKRFYIIVILMTIATIASIGQVGINNDNSLPDASAMLDVKSTSKGFLAPRMTATQMNLIASPAEGLLVYNTSVKSLFMYNGSAWKPLSEATSLAIGDIYGGGVVFFVYDGGKHGLIAATSDQHFAAQWYNGINRMTGTTGDGSVAGSMNTAMIVSTQIADNQNGSFAAKICADYSVTVNGITYGDWYLPSKYELNLLFQQKNVVGGFSNSDYWSSTESNAFNAWSQYFYDGFQSEYGKSETGSIRAIRSF